MAEGRQSWLWKLVCLLLDAICPVFFPLYISVSALCSVSCNVSSTDFVARKATLAGHLTVTGRMHVQGDTALGSTLQHGTACTEAAAYLLHGVVGL